MVTTENRKFDAIISNVSHKSNYSLVKMQEIVKGQTIMWIFELLIFKWRADIENNISLDRILIWDLHEISAEVKSSKSTIKVLD